MFKRGERMLVFFVQLNNAHNQVRERHVKIVNDKYIYGREYRSFGLIEEHRTCIQTRVFRKILNEAFQMS